MFDDTTERKLNCEVVMFDETIFFKGSRVKTLAADKLDKFKFPVRVPPDKFNFETNVVFASVDFK